MGNQQPDGESDYDRQAFDAVAVANLGAKYGGKRA